MLSATSTYVLSATRLPIKKHFIAFAKANTLKIFVLLFSCLSIVSAGYGQAVSGTLTVNPAQPSGGTNFKRIGEVDTFLMARGINGPVDIKIYNGTYNQANIVLNTVQGSSATNTIKFSSFSNDSLQVNITSNFQVRNVSYVTLEKIRLAGSVNFSGTGTNNTVQNCNITGIVTSVAGSNFTLINSHITGGALISKDAGYAGQIDNIIIANNTFLFGAADALGFKYLVKFMSVAKPRFENNTVRDVNLIQTGFSLIGCCTSVPYEYGGMFDCRECTDSIIISKNKFIRSSTKRLVSNTMGFNQVGIGVGTLSFAMISNNFISFQDPQGFNLGSSVPASFIYNNVNNIVTTSGSSPYFSTGSNVVEFRNNILSAPKGGLAAMVDNGIANSNYNNYFTTGPLLVNNSANLAAWKTASSKDDNSKSVNPKYTDSVDLHVNQAVLLAAGIPTPTANPILKDIDNENRNQLNPCIGADEFQVISADAGLRSVGVLVNNFAGGSSQPIQVKFTNFGSATLSQLNVNWSVNGVVQTPYVWTGSLPYDSTLTNNVTIGDYTFEMNKLSTLKVWVSLPNGAADFVNSNDTLQVNNIIPYSQGVFTLGGTNATFTSFSHADSILTRSGVNGPVTINIRNGKYTEQAVFRNVRGTSAANTITYRGEANNADSDTLSFNATLPAVAYTLKLDSALHVQFKNITFQSLGTNYFREVEMVNKTAFITFDSCVFTAANGNSNGSFYHLESTGFTTDTSFTITNNTFKNGGGGIKARLASSLIKNNKFIGLNGGAGLYIIDAVNGTGDASRLTIDNNISTTLQTCSFQYLGVCYSFSTTTIGGINIGGSASFPLQNLVISNNQLYQTSGRGIFLQPSSSISSPSKIFNNMVAYSGTGNAALRIDGANVEVYHNSFADSTNINNALIELNAGNINFRNNIATKGMAGSVYNFSGSILSISNANLATLTSNFNSFYNIDTAKVFLNGSNNLSFNQWKTLTSKDANSNVATPSFKNVKTDLHIDNLSRGAVSYFAAGTPISYIVKDIDDSTRSTTNPAIGADEFTLLNIDAGAEAIVGVASPLPNGANTVSATIKNFGTANIASAQVNWSVNGVAQAAAGFAGNLASGVVSQPINLGTFNFNEAINYRIAVWVSNPNGSADINAINDTVFLNVKPALCGTYTIGGSTPTFATPKAAIKYVNEAGVSCAVTFNIRNGEYSEADTLQQIPGASAVNTITFQSESGDSSLVKISQPDGFTGGTYILQLLGTDFVRFNKITFQRISSTTTYYSNMVALANASTNNVFSNCQFISNGTGVHIANNVIFAINYVLGKDTANTFINNRFTGGQQGIILAGQNTNNLLSNLKISNNSFRSLVGNSFNTSDKYAVSVTYSKNLEVNNNLIDSIVQGLNGGGIYIAYLNGKGSVSGNNVIKRKRSYGIYLDNVTGGTTFAEALIVANNIAQLDSTNFGAALYASIGSNVKILHNTLVNSNNNSNSAALRLDVNGTPAIKDTVRNNIIVATRGGVAYSSSANNTRYFSSHNNIYITGSSVFSQYNSTVYNTLAALQTASGMEAGSKNIDPLFISSTNFHVGELNLNAAAPTYIKTDIDGDVRSLVSPTIGADELVINNNDAGIVAMTSPAVPFAAGTQNVQVSIRNFGGVNLTSATINWSVNGVLQTPFSFVGSVASNSNSTPVGIGTYNFLINTNYTIKAWTSNPNGGTDQTNINDTLLLQNVFCALNGPYTIGGATPQFNSFNQAAANLRYGGVLGNVTFNVRDGKYYEQVTLDSIPFQNNYVVTWQGQSLDSSKVYLGYTGFNGDVKYGTIEVRRAKNQIVKNMTIGAKKASCPTNIICNPSISATHNAIIAFQVKNSNIQFLNNHFIDSSYDVNSTGGGTGGYDFITNQYPSQIGAVPGALGSYDTSITFANNRFSKVNSGNNFGKIIELKGITVTTFSGSTSFTTNHFNLAKLTLANNIYAFNYTVPTGLIVRDVDTLVVTGNTFQGSADIDGKNWALIDKNKFDALTITATGGRASGKPYFITNNMVTKGLSVFGDRVNIIHNTIAFMDTTSNRVALTISGTNDTLLNNVLYNNSYGYVLGGNLLANNLSNYNAMYASRVSPTATTLAQWRTANTGQDVNSVEGINPYFRGATDLHATNILLKVAPQLAAYSTDFDGQSRTGTVCIGADEFMQPANDIVITAVSPNKIFPAGNNDIKVRVYNNGSNAITSFNTAVKLTNYADDYTATAAGQINYTFSGNLAAGASQEITLGQLNVPIKRNQLKINIINTNGVADDVPYNDSIENNRWYAGLSGTYTYGSGGNFQNADLLQKQLHFGAVATPSTINVIAGTRSINLIIDSIPSLAQLIIQSADGDSSNTGFVGAQPIRMFRASNVVFRKLLLDGDGAGNGIILGYNSKNITVENCLIKAANVTSANTSSYYPGYGLTIIGNYSGMTVFNDSGYIVRNNNFVGGGVGVAVTGYSLYYTKQLKITGNTFTNQVVMGIDINGADSVLVENNLLSTNSATSNFYALEYNNTVGKFLVKNNKFYIKNDGIGIRNFSQYAYQLADSSLITNNFISVGATSSDTRGISISISKNMQIVHNTIYNRSTSAGSGAFYAILPNFSNASVSTNTIVNNIFYNKFLGIPVELYKNISVAQPVQHHNLLFTNGSIYGRITNTTPSNGSTVNTYATLATLATSGIEYSSVSGNPLFISDSDLHVDGVVVNNVGTYDVSVKDDIDGEQRSTTNPDIGADEITLPNFGAVQLESPLSSCSHTTTEAIKVWIKNFGTQSRSNIPVAYRINNGTVVLDTVRALVNGGDSVLFTFGQTANLLAPSDYYFDVWSNYRGDSLPSNDTLKRVLVATTPANNMLPYYTGFEGTNGGWYSTGQNNSFKWGVIFSGIIDSAANGLNAWKSNLTGPHNNNELSYMYSPCFDLSSVNVDPVLNFNLAFQLENNVDKAWVEWSSDGGANWFKLGTQGQGLAWYNNAGNYWTGSYTSWHNAKYTLPTGSLGDKSKVRVRFVLQTNGSNVQDGLAIDDVSIYIGSNAPVSNGTYVNRTANSTGSGTFLPVNDPGGNRLIEINDNGQSLGTVTVDVNQNNGGVPTIYNGQTFLGRSFVIRVQNQPTTPVTVRLFITQAEYDAWRALDPTIDLARNVAVYKFSNSIEDFDVSNNSGGSSLTIQPAQIVKVPYLDGYFLEFSVTSFSEFWITTSFGGQIVLPVQFVKVNAGMVGQQSRITWQVDNEIQVKNYQVLHSTNGLDFTVIGTIGFQNGNPNYLFNHINPQEGTNYYKVKQVDINGSFKLSAAVQVTRISSRQIQVYPTVFESRFFVQQNRLEPCSIVVTTADGKKLLDSKLISGINVIDLGKVTNGIYFYKIIKGGVVISAGKLLKN